MVVALVAVHRCGFAPNRDRIHRSPVCTTYAALAIDQSWFGPVLRSPHPYFGAKLSIVVAVPSQITTIYGCRLYGYQQKVNVSSSKIYTKTRRAIKDTFLVGPNHIFPRQTMFWSKIECFGGCCD